MYTKLIDRVERNGRMCCSMRSLSIFIVFGFIGSELAFTKLRPLFAMAVLVLNSLSIRIKTVKLRFITIT